MEITSRALKIIATERNFIAAKNLPCVCVLCEDVTQRKTQVPELELI